MKKLIVNADDFGLTEGVTQGILEAMEYGVVTSTTAMAAIPGAPERIAAAAPLARGQVGLHLMLTNGRPVLPPEEVPSLLEPDGSFPRNWEAMGKRPLDPDQVRAEWRAQLKLLRGLGVSVSHLDSHHNIHLKPEVFPVYLDLAKEEGLPLRASGFHWVPGLVRRSGVACPDHSEVRFSSGEPSPARFLKMAEDAFRTLGGEGVVEIMCHPGRVDDELRALSHYLEPRERELATLMDPALARGLAEAGIEPTGWDGLAA